MAKFFNFLILYFSLMSHFLKFKQIFFNIILFNTDYKNKVLRQLRNIPYIIIVIKIDDYIPISSCLYYYFEEPNVIEIIVAYLN